MNGCTVFLGLEFQNHWTTEPPTLSAFRGGRPAVHIDGDVYPTALAVGDRFAWPRRREQGGDGWVPNLKAVV